MKKKKIRRIISMILTLFMAAECMPGCNNDLKGEKTAIVTEGACLPIVCPDGGDSVIAGYMLFDMLKTACGAEKILPEGENLPCIKILMSENTDETGDCGYIIKGENGGLTVRAYSLAGFENAFETILKKSEYSKGRMLIAEKINAAEKIDSGANYKINYGSFYESYTNAPFYNDKNDAAAYVCNAMWHMFGAVDDGQNLVYRFGNEPTWYEWMSEKIMWSGDEKYIGELKEKIRNFPQTSVGYMWDWSDYPYWKVDDTYSIHYDGTFRIISAVYDVISWENSTDFLYKTDDSTAAGEYSELDASNGRTVLEKVEKAWEYILHNLRGETGIVKITEESVYLNDDGSQRFDFVKEIRKNCWNNTGLANSASSNYWDNLCFGNYDAYENALFYESCQAMIGIYKMLGGEYQEKIHELEALKLSIKENYDKYFWNDKTGRYIGTIDTEGNEVDYGFTFVNFEALKYGLGDAAKAELIFQWIDGTRTVKGDTRTGGDIMSYNKMMENTPQSKIIDYFDENLSLAAVSNTKAINNEENKASGKIWWHGPAGIDPWSGASYGAHCENGGYIFYTVFYELLARAQYIGAQSVTERLAEIARVYEYNRLISDESAGGASWLEGLIGEFPESGLVPTVYLYGLLGISAEDDGLRIEPNFNKTYEVMGVKSLSYGCKNYSIEENRNGTLTIICKDGELSVNIHYKPEHFEKYTVTVYKNDGSAVITKISKENGTFPVIVLNEGVKAEISPEY